MFVGLPSTWSGALFHETVTEGEAVLVSFGREDEDGDGHRQADHGVRRRHAALEGAFALHANHRRAGRPAAQDHVLQALTCACSPIRKKKQY